MESQLHVLIVDDAKFSSTMIQKSLTQNKVKQIDCISNAAEALAAMQTKYYAVVIVDWMMPDMDGIELTQHIRQLDITKHQYTYIIMLTARDGVDALQYAFDQGVDDFVNKSEMQQQLPPRVMAGARMIANRNLLLQKAAKLEQQNKQLISLARVNLLTGLGDKNYAIKRIDEHLRFCDSRGGAICLLLLRYKKTAQQQQLPIKIQQEIIKGVAKRLQATVRPLDDVAQLDSYNFVIITHQHNLDNCIGSCYKRIRDNMHRRSIETSTGFETVDINIGIAAAHHSLGLPSADNLIRLALDATKRAEQSQLIEHNHYQPERINSSLSAE